MLSAKTQGRLSLTPVLIEKYRALGQVKGTVSERTTWKELNFDKVSLGDCCHPNSMIAYFVDSRVNIAKAMVYNVCIFKQVRASNAKHVGIGLSLVATLKNLDALLSAHGSRLTKILTMLCVNWTAPVSIESNFISFKLM